LEAINTQKQAIVEDLNAYKFRDGLSELMNLARIGNKYLADMEPWKVYKEDPIRVQSILNVSLQISAALAQLMEPFMPFTAQKLQGMLNISSSNWENVNTEILQAGHALGDAGLLFQKIEDEAIQHQIQKLEQSKIANQATEKTIKPMKDSIQFDDFAKVDLRLGTILEAERVPKTDKLLKLKVDTGIDQRTIVSGIAHCFNPEDIIGKQVTVLVNLEPRKIKGIESQGMLLMAEDAEGKLQFLQTNTAIENGSSIS
jgi:methionyl-tRNA synthetase